MNHWAPAQYLKRGEKLSVNPSILEAAIHSYQRFQIDGLPAILTLNHLAKRTGVSYKSLRNFVRRNKYSYHDFHMKKRSGGKRVISVPISELCSVQRWIDQKILASSAQGQYSFAFEKGRNIRDCAEMHLGCRWLIKIDLKNFFESLTEIQVYKLFYSLGYARLVAFELARICTKTYKPKSFKYNKLQWRCWQRRYLFYNDPRVGHLPQGAPTSPRLANAIARNLDEEIAALIDQNEMVYTRYADDIIISIHVENFTKEKALILINNIYRLLPRYGLRPNLQKTQISHPGARKIVLGLLVDGDRVRLPKQFRSRLECNLYYCCKDPSGHAERRGFRTVLGLRNYIEGQLSYVRSIDIKYYEYLVSRKLIPAWEL